MIKGGEIRWRKVPSPPPEWRQWAGRERERGDMKPWAYLKILYTRLFSFQLPPPPPSSSNLLTLYSSLYKMHTTSFEFNTSADVKFRMKQSTKKEGRKYGCHQLHYMREKMVVVVVGVGVIELPPTPSPPSPSLDELRRGG